MQAWILSLFGQADDLMGKMSSPEGVLSQVVCLIHNADRFFLSPQPFSGEGPRDRLRGGHPHDHLDREMGGLFANRLRVHAHELVVLGAFDAL